MPGVDNAFSIEELTAYKGLLELSEQGNPAFQKSSPASLDETSLLPWLKTTYNAISEASRSLKVRSLSAQLDSISLSDGRASMISDNDETIWFTSTENPLHGAANAKRKMDFGMQSLGQSVAQGSNTSVAWSDVEVVGEVTNQARLDSEKILQFCDYARFTFFNQVDRVFLFGLLIHKEDCYVVLFTSTCIIMARPIKLSNALHITRLVAALRCVGNVGRGRDLKFRRSWSSVYNEKHGEEESPKLQYTLQYKLAYGHVELELHIIGHLHRTFSLLGRRTHVVLCRVSRNFTNPDAVSVDAGDHVVLKISAIDKESYYNESHLYRHLEQIGAWAVPLIVADEADGGNGDTDTTLKNMAVIMKKLEAGERLPEKYLTVRKRLHRKPSYTKQSFSSGIVNRERRYIIMATVGTPLMNTSLTFSELCNAIADVLTSLRSYGPESDIESPDRVLHRDISISNIIVSVPKGDVILLDNKCFVRARQDTRWGGSGRNITAAPIDLDLSSMGQDRTNLKTLTGHMAFIAPSVLLEYGSHRHLHQDVVSTLLCFMWMLCAPPLHVNEKTIQEVDRYEPIRPPRAVAKSLPPRTGYIPGQSTLKTLTRAYQHPFSHWGKFSTTSKLEALIASSSLLSHCQYQENKAFFSLLKSEMLEAGLAPKGKYSWMVESLLEYRLKKKGDERDSAAHFEYLTIMNERSLGLIDLCVDILRTISEE